MTMKFNSQAEFYVYWGVQQMVKHGVRYGDCWNNWKNTNWHNIVSEETLNKFWKQAENDCKKQK